MNIRYHTRNILALITALALAITTPITVRAQTKVEPPQTSEDQDETVILSPFDVKSDSNVGYGSASTSSTSRKTQNYIDVPQTVSVVTSKYIDDYNIQDTRQLLQSTPNSQFGPSTDGSQLLVRGAYISTTYIDGVVSPAQFTEMPLQFFDRVELVKGPSSSGFGIGAPGGLINYVSKTPQGRTGGSLTVGIGDNSNYLANFDMQGISRTDSRLQYRLVGFWQEGGYVQWNERHSGLGAQLALKFDYDSSTRFNAIISASKTTYPNRNGYETIATDPLVYRLVEHLLNGANHGYLPETVFPDGSTAENPSFAPGASGPNTIPVLGTGKFAGPEADPLPGNWQGGINQLVRINTFVTKDLADNHLHLRAALINDWLVNEEYGTTIQSLDTHFSNPSLPAGDAFFTLGRSYGASHPSQNRVEFDIAGEANFLGGKWETQAGVDAYQDRASHNGYSLPGVNQDGSTVYLSFFHKNDYVFIPNDRFGSYNSSDKQDGHGFYVQEDASFFGDRLVLSAGSRIDRFHTVAYSNNVVTNDEGWKTSNKNGAPRFAVTVKPLKWLSVYGLYAKHYDPTRITNKYFVDVGNYQALSPELQAQYSLTEKEFYSPFGLTKEVGAKATFFDGKLYASVAAFKESLGGQTTGLVALNTTGTDGTRVQLGYVAIQSIELSGGEAEIFGKIKKFTFVASYGITRGTGPAYPDGKPDIRKPPTQTNLHLEYDFTNPQGNGAYVNFGGTMFGPFLMGIYDVGPGLGRTYFYDPDYQYVYDAGAGYKWKNGRGSQNRVALSSTNIANKIILMGNPWHSFMPLRTITLTYSRTF
jgi:outer membrane receptor protein involved in Fe transport